MKLIPFNICFYSKFFLTKIKAYLLITFITGSFNVFAQSSSLISNCGDFVSGPNSWPYVLVATTIDSGTVSQGSQTYSMNVTSLPAGGANVRVYKTVANGNDFFGNPIALTLGSNSITVPAVTFDRAVKFQFSNGAVEFDALSLNGVASTCVVPLPPSSTSLISSCNDFISGPTAWPFVLVATTIADGVASHGAQTFTMNVTSLPAGGANFRVFKTTANGSSFFGNPIALTLGSNTITVPAVTFDRAVKFQFSNGAVEFDALSLNGVTSTCACTSIATDTVTACDSFIWIDGNTYTSSNNTSTYTLINSSGCDSVIILNLTIYGVSSLSTNISSCDSYVWNGLTFTSSGIYTQTFTNNLGCDSVVTLNLTINQSDSSLIYITACDSYDWNGNTYTSSGLYTQTFINNLGCDSIITLILTINQADTSSTNITACDSYDWNGNTYTSSGIYNWNGSSATGCDSTAILVLAITGSSTTSNISTCDSYTWNGNTYSSSGIYIYNNGTCVDSLILTINNSSSSSTNITICGSYEWNGNTYNSSGTYFWNGSNIFGCDSIAILNLTINNSSLSYTTLSACDSLHWNGITYTSSGIYTWLGSNIFGCDSTVTLDLTINQADTSSTNIIACYSYDWNGNTYISSGLYTWTGISSFGCDSIATLNLTINNFSTSTTTISACDSLNWNDTTYTLSGTYTWTTTNSLGCDSVASLNLIITTLNPIVNIVNDSTLEVQSLVAGTTYQWVDCNDYFAPIIGETNSSFITQDSGYYAVEVSLNGCSVLSDCFTINSISSIDVLDLHYGIKFYPNPTRNDITVSLVGIDIVDVHILDINGILLLKKSGLINQDRIDLSSFFSGIYFLKTITKEGTRVIRVNKQ